jgi:hypothetical protein
MTAAFSTLSVALLGILMLVALVRTRWAIVLVFAYSGIEQLIESFSVFFASKSSLINIAVGVVSLLTVVRLFVFGERPFRGAFNPVSMLVFALYGLAFFGLLYSMMPAAATYFLKTGFPYYALFLVLVPAMITRTTTMNDVAIMMLVVGCAVMIAILISPRTIFYGSRMFIDLSYSRIESDSRGNPLAIGELGGTVVIFATLMRAPRVGSVIALFRTGAVVLGLAICFLAAVRGQLVFSVFFSVLLFPLANRVRDVKQFLIRSGFAGAACGVVLIVYKLFLSGSESADRFSAAGIIGGLEARMYFLTQSFSAYASNPGSYLQGLGTGSFNAVVRHEGDGFLYPHNLFIDVLMHQGLLGFGLLMLIFGLTARSAWVLFQRARHGLVDRNAVSIAIALCGYQTMISMKQGTFMLYPLPFYMFLVLVKMHKLSDYELAEAGAQAGWDDPFEGAYHGDGDGAYAEYGDEGYGGEGYGSYA